MAFKTVNEATKSTFKSLTFVIAVGFASLTLTSEFNMAHAQATAVYSRIDVAGNARIASDTIRSIAGIASGDRVTPGQVNAATQNLNKSGLFESVDVRPEGGRLVIEVVEHPTINLIRVEGNKKIKDDVLLELLQSKSRRAFSPILAEADAKTIAEAYSVTGRLAATVSPKIIRRSDNRVDLVFEVKEGKITEIGRITIIGNRIFSDRRLKRVLATKQAGLLKSVVKGDTYIEDRLAVDKQQLRQFYLKRGYIDFQVQSTTAEFAKQRNSFQVTYTIQEGQPFEFGEVTIISLESDIDAEEYQKLNSIKSGSTYIATQIDSVLERIDHQAALAGKNFVHATPRITRNNADRTLDIEISIVRGQRRFVERIDIEGNSTTLDRVIRGKFDTVEGDPFNQREVRQATNRVRKTGFFKSVDVQTREGSSPEQVILDVNLEEQSTGTLGFGITASTDSGLGVAINIQERNFLGRGQSVGASINASSEDSLARFNFVEPAFLGRDLRFGLNMGFGTVELSDTPYDTATANFSPSISFPISKHGRLRLFANFSSDNIKENSDTGTGNDDPGEASIVMQNDFGKTSTGILGASYSIDKRNSIIEPTSGYNFSVTQQFAGFTGDRTYSRTTMNAKYFKALFNEEVILTAEVEGGIIISSDPATLITERFMLGGASLRGFEQQGVGPRDTTVDQSLGGNQYYAIRTEASFPIGLPEEYGIHAGIFLDIGSLWGLDFNGGFDDTGSVRASVGLTLYWETPIGPLRFDFASPFKKEDYDDTETFRFSVATRF
ncbi:MAG: outer membrane protein assembly factor BamA [Proteobacteria bacterium]|nr:outer membrane protein assembly factor BamA [Pseudomonadota bacterium]